MAWNLHAIEQTQSQGRRRVSMAWGACDLISTQLLTLAGVVFSRASSRISVSGCRRPWSPPWWLARGCPLGCPFTRAQAVLPAVPGLPRGPEQLFRGLSARAVTARVLSPGQMRSAALGKVAASGLPTSEPPESPFCVVLRLPGARGEPSRRSRRGKSGKGQPDVLLQQRGAPTAVRVRR